MPTQNDIKTFFSGKQNRDNDPRVIPNGEYVSLINGRIARSEEGGVGALENALGNSSITTYIDATAVVLGSVRDVSMNKVYYFVHGVEEDSIYEYSQTEDTYIPLVRDDRTPSLLNFNVDYLITGINIVGENEDRLLLWTDGFNPPRKINIQRSKDRFNGSLTDANGLRITDEFISVVKTPPLASPLVTEVRIPEAPLSATVEELDTFLEGEDLDLGLEQKQEKVEEIVNLIDQEGNLADKFPRFAYRWRYEDNEYSVLSPFSEVAFRAGRFQVDASVGILEGMENEIKLLDISFNTGPREVTEIELVYKEDGKNEVYVVESYNKFDRQWGNNVDLSSLNIETGERPVRFSSQKLYRLLPSRELARVYDAVPITAKAQEIIDNRVVYGNYVDQYDLIDVRKEYDADGNLVTTHMDPIVVNMSARRSTAEDLGIGGGDQAEEAERNATTDVSIPQGGGYNNLKSDRDYELGIVYLDDIGRQTPVLTSQNNTFHIPAVNANTVNRITVDIESKAPEFATGYRFFVKQTKDTFYNIFPKSVPFADTQDLEGSFLWVRIPDDDQNKVKAGDYVSLKFTSSEERTRTDGKELLRVDQVEAKDINFLENTVPMEGEPIIVKQSAGIYMRLEDTRGLFSELDAGLPTTANNEIIKGDFGSNNTSGSPIVGTGSTITSQAPIVSYNERTVYYAGPNTDRSIERPEEDAFIVSGTYNPGATANASFEGDSFSGSQRISLQVLPSRDELNVRFRMYYWIGTDGNFDAIGPTDINIPIAGTKVTGVLPNGVEIQIDQSGDDWAIDDFKVGDKYTMIQRNAGNFLWGRYESTSTRNPDHNPNTSLKRKPVTARKANAVIPLPEGRITQGSQIQLGVVDGVEASPEGDPIALQFNENIFIAGRDYTNFEEMIFEEQLYLATRTGAFDGTGNNPGSGNTPFEQMGFWRGTIANNTVERPFQDFGAGNNTERVRITQGVAGKENEGQLGLIINSGTYTPDSNKNSPDKLMSVEFYFSPGSTVQTEGTVNNVPWCFETQPEDSVLDLYYEIPDTFTCLNGIHFGNEMSSHQVITYENAMGMPVTHELNELGNPIPLTETRTVSKITVNLDYTNCIAFSNGIESMSIRDEVEGNVLGLGAKVNTVSQRYRERDNIANLIYSQRFNAQDGVNGLNDFSSTDAALEGIIKELDVTDGSIQKLFSKDTNLIVFQEDKVNNVLVNKDQLLNADGSSNIVSSQVVLGQTVPYAGEFGISKNPESFAVYGNQIYFSDRNRGSIMRLSQNGLTEISNVGMRDFFRDELAYMYTVERDGVSVMRQPMVLGVYDDYHDQYLISLREPLESPKEAIESQSLLLSKQAFLSRNDACRYPANDLQFTEVYEFFTPSGTAPVFNEGDIIFYDEQRTSRFNGDNDWFVYFQEQRVGETRGTGSNPILQDTIVDLTAKYLLEKPLDPQPLPGQEIIIHQQAAGGTQGVHNARIIASNGNIIEVVYDEGTILDPVHEIAGAEIEFDITHKFVIQIDRFGFVLDKLDCLHIVPLNHDAVRVSLRGFFSPQDACGKGIVARVVYHNGDDPTPDVGDSIFDSAFGRDEFFEGNYFKGRTQKRGWYKMFDGSDFEDYVINIVQGKVVTKVRCAEIDAGRRRILTSMNPVERRVGESEVRLATRICAILPTEENFHNGESQLPVPGDTMYADNFSNSPLRAGYYAVEGGYYVELSNTGTVRTVRPCTITLCFDDVIGQSLLDLQNNSVNSFRFLGTGGVTEDLPDVIGTPAVVGDEAEGTLVFNGALTDLGDFRSAIAGWYYQIGGDAPTEYLLYTRGSLLEGGEVTNTGSVTIDTTPSGGEASTNTAYGITALTPVYNMFTVRVGNIVVTTDVFTTRSGRTITPTFVSFVVDNSSPLFGSSVNFTTNITNQEGDFHTFVLYKDGVVVSESEQRGAINDEFVFTIDNWTSGDDGIYTLEVVFSNLILESETPIDVREIIPIPPVLALATTFNADVDGATIVATGTDDDQPDGVPLNFRWTSPGAPVNLVDAPGGYDPPFHTENLQAEDGDNLQDEDGDTLEGFVPNQ